MKDLFVYILTNAPRHTVLYIGVTNDLETRLWQHSNAVGSHFAHQYNANTLIYYEVCPDPNSAIAREKQLKGWSRPKKEKLIATLNPEWRDLADELFRRE